MSRTLNAFLFPASFLVGFGFLESVNLAGKLLLCSDKHKSSIFRLSCIALLGNIASQLLLCMGLDYSISPYPTSRILISTILLGAPLTNQITMICMNLSALLLIHTFFRTQRIIFMSWLLLGGLCIINRLCIFYLAFGAFIPFTNGTYTGSNFAQNPDYWPYSTAVALSAVFESVFLALASITFIRHIVLQLQLPKQQILNVMIMNFGGLKFLGLILMRFFSAGLIFRLLMNAWKADSLTSLSSYTSAVSQSWSIFIVVETAFFVTQDLMKRGSGSRVESIARRSMSEPVSHLKTSNH